MTAFIEVGEFITMQSCLVLVFVVLATLFSIKFGLLFKIAKPIFGFLGGMCVGAYLTSLINYDYIRCGTILFGIIGLIGTLMLGNSSSQTQT